MSVEVTYSTATPQSQIRDLTAFDFSCLTRRRPCLRVEDILPAARPWHLYQLDGDPPEPEQQPSLLKPCDIPVWALGRDAASVLAIEVLSISESKSRNDGSSYEKAKVRFVETLKGAAPWHSGTTLDAYPFSGENTNPPLTPTELLQPGRHYIALIGYSFHPFDRDDPPLPPGAIEGVPAIGMDRCGVLDDTPRNRIEFQRGFAQNDQLRAPEF